jgi:hypothetical protein
MGLAADGDGAGQVGRGEGREGVEEALPAGFPVGQQVGAGGERVDELVVAVAPGLLAVGGEEVGPPRAQFAL